MPPKAVPVEITEKQLQLLHFLIRRQKSSQALVRRIRIVLEASAGHSNLSISRSLRLNRESVIRWRSRWTDSFDTLQKAEHTPDLSEDDFLTLLEEVFDDAPRSGTPPTYTSEQIVQIIAIACEPPSQSNRPVSHWVAEDIVDEAIRRKIVPSISPRSVRRFLKRSPIATPSISLLAQRKKRKPRTVQ